MELDLACYKLKQAIKNLEESAGQYEGCQCTIKPVVVVVKGDNKGCVSRVLREQGLKIQGE